MKWSWKIGEFAGIGLYIHATFPLLLVFAALPVLLYGGEISEALSSIAFILALFVCVVLHEYGHALAARRYGIKTQDITLLPIGGVARLERMPEKPSQELVVAAAGPAVNVVIAAALAVAMFAAGAAMPTLGLGWGNESVLEQLLTVNIVLVLFNLIPAFPMDGGRILRALLATRMDHAAATRYAAMLGQGIAVVFAVAGFFVNPLLVLTALFIFMGAGAESQMAQQRGRMRGMTAGQAMRTNIRALAPYERLSGAVDSMMSTGQQDFPIAENGRVVGMLTREMVIKGLKQFGAYAPVAQVMQQNVVPIEADQPLASAMDAMQSHELAALPVTSNGALVGMLTFDGIREFLALQKMLKTRERPTGETPIL
ncbi:MAG: site-2 protease family protein [Anaerolineae bacterium]|nr:site-2 protease family protein [Anaerolineae bacterium]